MFVLRQETHSSAVRAVFWTLATRSVSHSHYLLGSVLRAACCVLRVACCMLRAACCVLRVACCVLRAACCVLRLRHCIRICKWRLIKLVLALTRHFTCKKRKRLLAASVGVSAKLAPRFPSALHIDVRSRLHWLCVQQTVADCSRKNCLVAPCSLQRNVLPTSWV
jgi:hypothetical protein